MVLRNNGTLRKVQATFTENTVTTLCTATKVNAQHIKNRNDVTEDEVGRIFLETNAGKTRNRFMRDSCATKGRRLLIICYYVTLLATSSRDEMVSSIVFK